MVCQRSRCPHGWHPLEHVHNAQVSDGNPRAGGAGDGGFQALHAAASQRMFGDELQGGEGTPRNHLLVPTLRQTWGRCGQACRGADMLMTCARAPCSLPGTCVVGTCAWGRADQVVVARGRRPHAPGCAVRLRGGDRACGAGVRPAVPQQRGHAALHPLRGRPRQLRLGGALAASPLCRHIPCALWMARGAPCCTVMLRGLWTDGVQGCRCPSCLGAAQAFPSFRSSSFITHYLESNTGACF